MFSQEDWEASRRVSQNPQLLEQLRPTRRNTGLKVWLGIVLFLFLASAVATAFLGYNVLYLYDALGELHNTLNQANQKVNTLSYSLDSERNERNRVVETLNQQVVEERKRSNKVVGTANQEIKRTYAVIASNEEQIDHLARANAGLEESVTQLDASVRRLESTHDTLVRERNTLTQENSALTRDKNSLTQRNGVLASTNNRLTRNVTSLNTQISTLAASLRTARAQQVTIPYCSTNYYTKQGANKLICVTRSSGAFRATQVETSSVDLPYSGRVNLKINRSGGLGSDRSMEILEHAVRTVEEYMGQPIPLRGNEIRLDFVDDLNITGGFVGVHKGTHMEVLQEYDAAAPAWGADRLGIIIAHEVAHYYWNAERVWMYEGAAEYLAIYSENKRVGRAMTSLDKSCTQARSISQLESRRYGPGDGGYTCNYTLGEGLFLDLYDNLTEAQFRRGFQDLWARRENKLSGVYQVRLAFPDSQSVIDRWYGYREKPEAHWGNGAFLGYMTWEEAGGWKLYHDQNGRPCATALRLNDRGIGKGYSVRETKHECQYTGEWDDQGDLLVTIGGTAYRAVEILIYGPP